MDKTNEDAIDKAAWFMEHYGDTYCALKFLNDATAGLNEDEIRTLQNEVLPRLPDDKARNAMSALFELLTYYRVMMREE